MHFDFSGFGHDAGGFGHHGGSHYGGGGHHGGGDWFDWTPFWYGGYGDSGSSKKGKPVKGDGMDTVLAVCLVAAVVGLGLHEYEKKQHRDRLQAQYDASLGQPVPAR